MRPLITPWPSKGVAGMARRVRTANEAAFHFPSLMMSISCEGARDDNVNNFDACETRHIAVDLQSAYAPPW
jgi:hypothetical protein